MPTDRKDTPLLEVTDRDVVAGGGLGAKALLDAVVREGARRMLILALEAERDEYVESLKHFREERGHVLVVKNGCAWPREIQLGVGAVEISAPRVDFRREGEKYTSQVPATLHATVAAGDGGSPLVVPEGAVDG